MSILRQLSGKQLDELYDWIDTLPLSKPKKNISRDFSDGSMMAETIYHYMPKIIDLHNYPSTNSLKGKKLNWSTLNTKILSKIGLQISNNDIENLSQSTPMAIESLLFQFKKKAKVQEKSGIRKEQKIQNKFEQSKIELNKAEELREILTLLKDKVSYLERNIQKKDWQIRELQQMIEQSGTTDKK